MGAIPALRFRQWIKDWDDLRFDENEHRRRPSPDIYLFAMPAQQLRALSGVFRRHRQQGVATGIQRGHDQSRSEQIADYVRFGYPYSEMSPARRDSFDSQDLRKPGWLPTAIVVNILTKDDVRRGKRVVPQELLTIKAGKDNFVEISLPRSFSDHTWEPSQLGPLEVIDGQHRLYAFGSEDLPGEFELPVVAFHGLDIGWQAYLFWSINVSPKKINPSHAFDLYPLLRSQDWLEKFAESNVYREARAQELTEFLFRHRRSPWKDRINMLGERGVGGGSQAAWVRSLTSTFLAAGRGRGAKGLFGCALPQGSGPLAWTRAQQGAFLIDLWRSCADAVNETKAEWAKLLRAEVKESKLPLDDEIDPAFSGDHTMLNQEQGVRGFLSVANDLFFLYSQELELDQWEISGGTGEETNDEEISAALKSLEKKSFREFSREFTHALALYDWRSADARDLSYDEKLKRRAFRGSGGYAALRADLLKELSEKKGRIAIGAKALIVGRQ